MRHASRQTLGQAMQAVAGARSQQHGGPILQQLGGCITIMAHAHGDRLWAAVGAQLPSGRCASRRGG